MVIWKIVRTFAPTKQQKFNQLKKAEKTMKVFVLNYLFDPTDDTSCSDALGVFKTMEEAKAAMKDEFQESIVIHEIEKVDGINVKIYEGDTDCSICD